jgi:hypothetical protein
MAPWKCSRAPSIGPCARAAPISVSHSSSKAARVTMPDGLALAEIGWIRVQPNFSAASRLPPIAERVPRYAPGISLPRKKPLARKAAISVGTRLKVLVSCMMRAVRTRFAIVGPFRWLIASVSLSDGATSSAHPCPEVEQKANDERFRLSGVKFERDYHEDVLRLRAATSSGASCTRRLRQQFAG